MPSVVTKTLSRSQIANKQLCGVYKEISTANI